MLRFKTYFTTGIARPLAMIAIVVMLVAGLSSCKRDIEKRELLSNYEVNTYSELFEVFWKGINTNYLFWDKDPVDWDHMYRVYKPKFAALDKAAYSDTLSNVCFQYMADMTKELKDGQYALMLWGGGNYRFDDSLYKSYISFIPKLMRTQRTRAALPDTLFDYVIQNNYLREFDYGIYRNFNTNQIFQVITGRLTKGRKNVLYTSFNAFMIKEAYNASYATRPPRPVLKNFFDNMRRSTCDAVIIDLRNNRGGNLEDVDFLVGQFTSKSFLFGYARNKSGVGRLDYTPPLPLHLKPQTGATDFKKPVIILADMYSAAITETVIQAFKALPDTKVTVIGENTYGTSGFVSGTDIATNGGTFGMGSFGAVRISSTALQDIHHNFNFSGIKPDLEVRYDASSIKQMLTSGVDIQLEKAIYFINQ